MFFEIVKMQEELLIRLKEWESALVTGILILEYRKKEITPIPDSFLNSEQYLRMLNKFISNSA